MGASGAGVVQDPPKDNCGPCGLHAKACEGSPQGQGGVHALLTDFTKFGTPMGSLCADLCLACETSFCHGHGPPSCGGLLLLVQFFV